MHLTGITKRAFVLIAVRQPAQPVVDIQKSEVNRTTAKLPGRNTTAIPPLHAIRSMIPDTSGNWTSLMTMQLSFQSWREYKSLQTYMSCLSGLDKVGFTTVRLKQGAPTVSDGSVMS